jgi:hypothetical protein
MWFWRGQWFKHFQYFLTFLSSDNSDLGKNVDSNKNKCYERVPDHTIRHVVRHRTIRHKKDGFYFLCIVSYDTFRCRTTQNSLHICRTTLSDVARHKIHYISVTRHRPSVGLCKWTLTCRRPPTPDRTSPTAAGWWTRRTCSGSSSLKIHPPNINMVSGRFDERRFAERRFAKQRRFAE